MGNVCSCDCAKSVDNAWDRLTGRTERHNPAGRGPSGKVSAPMDTKYNKNPEAAQKQKELYHDPEVESDDENYNPCYYQIEPITTQEEYDDEEVPDTKRVKKLKGSMIYDPKNEIGKIQVESEEEKKARIEQERIKQKPHLEKIKQQTEGDFDQIKRMTQATVHHGETKAEKVKSMPDQNGSSYQMVQPDAPIVVSNKIEAVQEPGWGEAPKQIEGLAATMAPIFDGAVLEGQVKYAYKDIVIENSKWQEIHQEIPGEFTDSSFPANLKSLQGAGRFRGDVERTAVKRLETYKFQRMSHLIPGIQVIVDGIKPTDIYQGQLGDCYFMSALASIAEHPGRIERNILQKTHSTKGAYCIALCITGCWIPIVVDDLFPIRPDGLLAFSYTKNREMWAMLFEKAYAKAYGAYWHVGNGGLTGDALRDITGAPTQYISLKEVEAEKTALKRLIEADQKNFIISASSRGSGETKNALGIIAGHAYTLSAIKTLSNGVQLLKLRNPWGKGEWTGNWGDSSNLWTPELKQQAEWTAEDDGTFFMTYNDFKTQFTAVTIAHYHDAYFYSYLKSENPDQAMDMQQFSVELTGEYYIGVSQPSCNLFTHDPNFKYGYISCIILRKLDNGNFVYVDGFANCDRDPWCKLKLEQGNYLALIYTNWNSANTTYTFWTYGVKNTEISKITDQPTLSKGITVLVQAFVRKALAETHGWQSLSSCQRLRSKTQSAQHGYGFFFIDNRSPDFPLVEYNITKTSTNWEYIYPQKGGDVYKLSVKSGKTRMLLYRSTGIPSSIGFEFESVSS